ncbi:response regulator [Erythrobacter sp. NE805]|uniref:response regulator n=1 Tax=Erythrobacter sp. NE805 TaxID=3389875 RepID=UPI00396B21CC
MTSFTNRRILVADDEPLVALMVADMLGELGAIPVGPARSFKQVSAVIGAGGFDGVVLDVNLGDGLSFPVARELRARGIPCCFATGYGGAAIPEEFADMAVLQKPYGTTALARSLDVMFREVEPRPGGDDAPPPRS